MPFPSSNVLYIFFNLLYLKRYRSGIYHVTGHVHYAALALPKESTILTIHDLVFMTTYKGVRRIVMKWLFLDLPVNRVKWITTVSEKTKQEIILHSRCDPNKIIVIENPVDPLLKFTNKSFNTVKPVLLFLGTKPNKNLENTIAAIYKLDVKLRIIGELTSYQTQLLRKFDIDYTQTKNLDDVGLREEYNLCDIVLFPSLYEGFGLPVIEAFAVGKTVITSNISPINIIAKDAVVYVNPNSIISIRNGLLKLISNPELRREKVSKGLEIIHGYQVDEVIDKYHDLWNKVAHLNLSAS